MTDEPTAPPTALAGWYVDPDDATHYRYWDGVAWTEHRSPATPPNPSTVAPPLPPRVPPSTRRRNTGRWLWVAAGVLGAMGLVSVLSGPGDKGSPSTTAASGNIGDPVRDGKLEFTVNSVDCGRKHVGGTYGETAQGQFCLVALTVQNIGTESQTFNAGDQIAYDMAGNQITADSMASSESTFLEDINPGNQVTGVVAFDIPVAQTLSSLELHDSMFSEGVTVNL